MFNIVYTTSKSIILIMISVLLLFQSLDYGSTFITNRVTDISFDRYLLDISKMDYIMQSELPPNYIIGPKLNTKWYNSQEEELWITAFNLYTDYYTLEPIFLNVWVPINNGLSPELIQRFEYKYLLYHAAPPVIYGLDQINLDGRDALCAFVYNGGGLYTITLFLIESGKINILIEDVVPGDIFWICDSIPDMGPVIITLAYGYDGTKWETYIELYKYSINGSREIFSLPDYYLFNEDEIQYLEIMEKQEKIAVINFKLCSTDSWRQHIEQYNNSNGTPIIKYNSDGSEYYSRITGEVESAYGWTEIME